jgi:hypothetical protein
MGTSSAEVDPGDHVDEILVPSGRTSTCHIPYEGAPRCGTNGTFRRKPLEVYPEAHRDWCHTCRQLWLQAQGPAPE